VPRRGPIDPQGIYHVGSRGVYGRTLWVDVGQHERFLWLYRRATRKHGIETLEWALVDNHHHLVVRLTNGGLSETMREVHGGYSRWLHAMEEQTRKGHAFRHAFFARRLDTERDVIAACAYVSANLLHRRPRPEPRRGDWSGYRALLGREHPRQFHSPHLLLELLDPKPARSRALYQQLVAESHARAGQDLSPNDMLERG
jgi:putative transposase